MTTRLRLFAIQIACIILPFIGLLGLQRVPTHQLWMVPLPTTTPCTNSTRRRNSSRRGPSVLSMRFSLQSHAYRGGSHQRDGWYWDRINSRIIPTVHMHAKGIVTNIKYPSSTRHPHILRSDHPPSCAHNWIFEETLICHYPKVLRSDAADEGTPHMKYGHGQMSSCWKPTWKVLKSRPSFLTTTSFALIWLTSDNLKMRYQSHDIVGETAMCHEEKIREKTSTFHGDLDFLPAETLQSI